MDDVEARLRALAAHRAQQIPAVVEDPRTRHGSRRRVFVIAAAIAVVLALVAGGAVLVSHSGDDGASVRVPPASESPTTPPTTAHTTKCDAPAGADTEVKAGPAARDPGAFAVKLTEALVNVDTQVSDCSDAAVFVFGSTPDWHAAYDTDGNLMVSFVADLGRNFAPTEQRASTLIQPPLPWRSGTVALDYPSSAEQTWVIHVGERRPFRVDATANLIEVEISQESPVTVTCANPQLHLGLTLPPGWFDEVSPYWGSCQFLGPRPFGLFPDSDMLTRTVIPQVNSDPTGPPDPNASTTTVDGRSAIVSEITVPGDGLLPPGTHLYTYVIDWSPSGRLVLSVHGEPGAEFDADKAGLDALAASATYTG
jgi:hypothetical protein